MRKLLGKLGAFSIGPMVGAVISFITVPLITYFISPEEYGKASMFTLAQTTVSTVMYLGMDQAFVREFNNYRDRVRTLLSNAVFIPMIVCIITSLGIVIFNQPVSQFLFDTKNETLAVIALAALLPFMVVENYAFLKIRMEEKGLMYSAFTILLKALVLTVTIVLFLLYEKSFRSVVYAAALGEIINGTILFILVIKPCGIAIKYIDKSLIKGMLKFGLPLVPAYAIGWILSSMDKIMLRTLCTYTELGLYSAAFKIVSVLSVLQSCFTLFWTPVAYRWYEEKRDNKYFEIVSKVVAILMTIMCLGILLCKNIVGLILGAEFVKAIEIFPFLLLYPVLYTVSETTGVGIGFKRKTGFTILTSAIAGGSNIILNMLLIPLWGGIGAAVATGVSYIFFFWGRTIISGFLWYRMKYTVYILLIAIIIANCIMHTFYNGILAYIVTIISLLVMIGIAVVVIKKYDMKKFVKEVN